MGSSPGIDLLREKIRRLEAADRPSAGACRSGWRRSTQGCPVAGWRWERCMRSPAPAMARWMVPRRLRLQQASWRAPRGKSSGVRDQDLFAPGLEAAGLACRSGRRAGGFGLFRGRAAPPRLGWGRGWPGPAGRGGRSSDRAPAHRSTSLSAELASVGERDATFLVPHGRGDQAKAEGLDPRETLGRKTGEINIPKLIRRKNIARYARSARA